MIQDKVTRWIACSLIFSGVVHLCVWLVHGQAWEGPLSLRKPILFGISGGLTVYSLGWVLECLPARPWERLLSRWTCWALLIEVGLITVQYWRGVPSHFNDDTALDRIIEQTMLILILMATAWIGWVCMRVQGPLSKSPAMNFAIRSGMIWLWLSCLLGIATTALGKWNIMHGQNYELWGRAGVLKFPHGIALHAIQFLPLCAWLLERWRIPRPYQLIRGLAGAQFWLVLFAIWQTWQAARDSTSNSLELGCSLPQ